MKDDLKDIHVKLNSMPKPSISENKKQKMHLSLLDYHSQYLKKKKNNRLLKRFGVVFSGAAALFLFCLLTLSFIQYGHLHSDPQKNSSNQSQNDWKLSPEFETETGYKVIGQKGKVGITPIEFEAGKVNKWLWLFWGDQKTIEAGDFKVIAVNKETRKKEQALVKDGGTPIEKKVWEYGSLMYSSFEGANSSIPSNMSLPSKGIWRLEVYIGSKPFGSVVVNVKK